uniref:Uncharacterized protein n=1 Tax=Physcomitrium patens TaxID=3218 RepID=A0A2K1IV05_PHYPA|nr:hypothetical protein PHYPA_025052 [Physcomitrium patens]
MLDRIPVKSVPVIHTAILLAERGREGRGSYGCHVAGARDCTPRNSWCGLISASLIARARRISCAASGESIQQRTWVHTLACP